MIKEQSSLDRLKKQYEEFRKKYNLPSFKEMNENFEIEKLQEKETELIAREIRSLITEKIVSYLRFIEMLLNPSAGAPLFFLSLIKNIDLQEREMLDEVYSKLSRYEIKSISLDNSYDEKKEAQFISEFYKEWQEIKREISEIMNVLENCIKKKCEKKEKNYLG
ncbi:hypothetical protein HYW76_05640 [Candidatus Pacearchaeota archaeon]|nr:hypothetical protein [Candidatus Pacearchaeota archaeon]